MGTYVYLHVLEDAIPPTAWAQIYDDTRSLLRAHPSGLLGLDERTLLGHDVLVYTRDIERMTWQDREICVVGDRRSLRFGESFHMPCRLRTAEIRRDQGEDLVFDEPDEPRGRAIFGDKTQGEPYHTAILAAAMVVETRFPGAARS
jgi:hypothetical protein